MISEPMLCLAQIVHLSCTNTNTISKRTKMIFHMTHNTMEFHRMRANQFLSLWYVWCKSCAYLAPTLTLCPNGRKKIPHDPRHLGVPLGVSKMISESVVCSAQTVHLSCVKASTVSKRTESSFHKSLITLDQHWVRPKRFPSLWYVWRKSCTDTNTAPNGPKRDST
jgi:hypothetical protein